jgi:hypothetical protein
MNVINYMRCSFVTDKDQLILPVFIEKSFRYGGNLLLMYRLHGNYGSAIAEPFEPNTTIAVVCTKISHHF